MCEEGSRPSTRTPCRRRAATGGKACGALKAQGRARRGPLGPPLGPLFPSLFSRRTVSPFSVCFLARRGSPPSATTSNHIYPAPRPFRPSAGRMTRRVRTSLRGLGGNAAFPAAAQRRRGRGSRIPPRGAPVTARRGFRGAGRAAALPLRRGHGAAGVVVRRGPPAELLPRGALLQQARKTTGAKTETGAENGRAEMPLPRGALLQQARKGPRARGKEAETGAEKGGGGSYCVAMRMIEGGRGGGGGGGGG